jgi:hypothetical protein
MTKTFVNKPINTAILMKNGGWNFALDGMDAVVTNA